MPSISSLLLEHLDELVQDDFKTFKSFLTYNMVQGIEPIPCSRLENAKQFDVVKLMVDKYDESHAAEITAQILEKISQKKLANNLKKKLEGLEDKVSEGKSVFFFFVFYYHLNTADSAKKKKKSKTHNILHQITAANFLVELQLIA